MYYFFIEMLFYNMERVDHGTEFYLTLHVQNKEIQLDHLTFRSHQSRYNIPTRKIIIIYALIKTRESIVAK